MSEDLLKALLQAAAAQSGGQQSSQADPLAGMLGSLLGGASAQSGAQSSQADPLAGLLGALLGGGGASAPAQPDIQTTLNEGEPQAGLDLGDLLGSLLGGGQATTQTGTELGGLGGILQPILTTLVQNLGLPPQIAQMVVTFALTTLLTGKIAGASGVAAAPGRAAQARPLDLGALLGKIAGGQVVSSNYLRSTGMAQALSAQTGLDQRTATLSLQQVLGELGSVMATQSQGVQVGGIGGSFLQQ